MTDREDGTETPDYLSYEEWGIAFFHQVVTEERILGAVNNLAGQPINVGPMGVGPGRIAQVRAEGAIGHAVSTALPGESVSYRVVLPVELTFDVNLAVDTHRFRATLEVPLILTARAATPLKIVIDVVPPLPDQVVINLRSDGLRASMLNRVVGIEGELQRFVAKYVRREVQKPAIAKARTIDVRAAVDGAMKSLGLPRDESTPRRLAADLEDAIVEEIRENEDTIVGGVSE
ncbi:MAG TPA: hypothetical protein VFK41_04140 [Nocardioidaceae bacterium]|nr:hypothetical protein [Nocardioidaceae bacterium]